MSVVAIPTDALELEEVAGFDLYLQQGGRYVLFRSKDYPLDKRALNHLRSTGLSTVFVHKNADASPPQVAAERLERVLEDKTLSHQRRAETVYQSACAAAARLARSPDRRSFDEAARVGSVVAAYATGDPWVVHEFVRLAGRASHDFANAVHIAAVATNVARALGFGFDELTTLTTACLVRDVGFSQLPARLRSAQGKLPAADRAAVERHVVHSADLLARAGADDAVRAVVAQHHERVDGSGYPNRMKGDAIAPLARVAAAADAFGALVVRRGYLEPLGAVAAFERLARREARKFDTQALEALGALISGGRPATPPRAG